MSRVPIRLPKESEILRAITDFLTAEHLLWFRMNSGGMFGQHNGKKWAVKFGMKGMADLLAFVPVPGQVLSTPLWIEAKTEIGRQSDVQKCFQALVEAHAHKYLLARSVDDVMEALKVLNGQ